MKTNALFFAALGSVSMLSADPSPACPGGNCPYPSQNSGRPYYQSNSQSYQQTGNPYQNHQRPNQNLYQDQEGYYIPSTNRNNSNSNDNASYNNNSSSNRSNIKNSTPSEYSEYRDGNRNVPRTVKTITDEEISQKVHEALSSNWISSGYPDVTFDVNNGTVNLRGYVKTQDEKGKLENVIKKIDGVKQVNSEISVDSIKSSNNTENYNTNNNYTKTNNGTGNNTYVDKNFPQDRASTDSDRQINSKIRNRLNGWFTKGFETIAISTADGVVTITGFVEKNDDLEKINKEAKAVDGVKTVNNKVTIKKKS